MPVRDFGVHNLRAPAVILEKGHQCYGTIIHAEQETNSQALVLKICVSSAASDRPVNPTVDFAKHRRPESRHGEAPMSARRFLRIAWRA